MNFHLFPILMASPQPRPRPVPQPQEMSSPEPRRRRPAAMRTPQPPAAVRTPEPRPRLRPVGRELAGPTVTAARTRKPASRADRPGGCLPARLRRQLDQAGQQMEEETARSWARLAQLGRQAKQRGLGQYERRLCAALARKHRLRLGLALLARPVRVAAIKVRLMCAGRLSSALAAIRVAAARELAWHRASQHRGIHRLHRSARAGMRAQSGLSSAASRWRVRAGRAGWAQLRCWFRESIHQLLQDDRGWRHAERRRASCSLLGWLTGSRAVLKGQMMRAVQLRRRQAVRDWRGWADVCRVLMVATRRLAGHSLSRHCEWWRQRASRLAAAKTCLRGWFGPLGARFRCHLALEFHLRHWLAVVSAMRTTHTLAAAEQIFCHRHRSRLMTAAVECWRAVVVFAIGTRTEFQRYWKEELPCRRWLERCSAAIQAEQAAWRKLLSRGLRRWRAVCWAWLRLRPAQHCWAFWCSRVMRKLEANRQWRAEQRTHRVLVAGQRGRYGLIILRSRIDARRHNAAALTLATKQNRIRLLRAYTADWCAFQRRLKQDRVLQLRCDCFRIKKRRLIAPLANVCRLALDLELLLRWFSAWKKRNAFQGPKAPGDRSSRRHFASEQAPLRPLRSKAIIPSRPPLKDRTNQQHASQNSNQWQNQSKILLRQGARLTAKVRTTWV